MARKSEAIGSGSVPSIESFEQEFTRLNALVDRLEAGNVPLGEMLKLYEESMELSVKLQEVLTGAELRVEKLGQMHEEQVSRSARTSGYRADSITDFANQAEDVAVEEDVSNDEEELLF